MKKYSFIIILGLLLPAFCFAFDMEKIFYMSQRDEEQGIKSLEKNIDKIDIIAPQFYGINSQLKLMGGLNKNLKKTVESKDAEIMPLVTNAGFKQNIIHKLLVSPKSQDVLIQSLVDVAKKEKYIGWQFDFENINYLYRDQYSLFIEKTARVFHKNKLILSVAVVSRSVDYENTDIFKNWSGVFDYDRIAKAVDFISLMTYDDPNSTGPVASLPFVNSVLDYVKHKIPPHKLSFGIPLYYWGWSTDPVEKINPLGSYSKLSSIMNNFRHSTGFSPELGASWLTYFWQNKKYEIWYQDKQGFAGRLDIIARNKFRGFSAWVLGVEDPSIWSTIALN